MADGRPTAALSAAICYFHLLPPTFPPAVTSQGRAIRQVFDAPWKLITSGSLSAAPPSPQQPAEGALSSKNPILSPHWPAAVRRMKGRTAGAN